MKKGRHRRFEEARKLKQAGPSALDLGFGNNDHRQPTQDDEYAALADRYGVNRRRLFVHPTNTIRYYALNTDRPAFKNVICLGHILDAKGEKMSKSRGM